MFRVSNRSVGPANLDLLIDPVRTAAGQPAALQLVACSPVRDGPQEAEFHIVRGQDKTRVRYSGQLLREFPERMEGECVGGQVDLMARPKPRLNEINHAICSRVGNNPHRRFSICWLS